MQGVIIIIVIIIGIVIAIVIIVITMRARTNPRSCAGPRGRAKPARKLRNQIQSEQSSLRNQFRVNKM
jgi:hypothetical protein